jgi:hypothetical protein
LPSFKVITSTKLHTTPRDRCGEEKEDKKTDEELKERNSKTKIGRIKLCEEPIIDSFLL